jgi:hypothetical protein
MPPEKLFLLSRQEISIVNHTRTARVFSEAVLTLWPDGLTFDNVLLLVTDAALYMTKREEVISVSCPKLLRVVFAGYTLHRVCETVRVLFLKCRHVSVQWEKTNLFETVS